ncbi:cholinesterase [Purpureocillium lavendulum]|uniref:Cholinesterase n=1 Tax=Purpureocillium lavendulum TaxID=1247861 RepID=A0AB34FPG2_9HYPO|nr:cholinesterase [Purpureocillium lavendulum]
MTLAPYESLPPEIRCAILEQIKWCKYRGWSTCAAVCKEWQPVIEEENFRRLKLGGECLTAFARIVRAREYVRHIWFDIQLPSYLCPSCEETEPTQRLANINSRYSFAHWFKHYIFSSSETDHTDIDTNPAVAWTKTIHDPYHNWHHGKFSPAPRESLLRLFAKLDLAFLCELPKVEAVTSLVIRRQLRRRLGAWSIAQVMAKLPRVEKLIYEPWRAYDRRYSKRLDSDFRRLLRDGLPQTLKRVFVFEDFDDAIGDGLALSLPMERDAIEATKALLVQAGRVALRMPELHTMVVWYADKDCAAAFIYHKGGDGGCITWRGSWDVELDHDVVAAWSRVAERNGGRPLRVFKELLKKNEFMCHGDAIYLLTDKMKVPLQQLALLPYAATATATATRGVVAPTATLDAGPVFGASTSLPGAVAPVNKFLGIPYAAPPQRFRLPTPPAKWTRPRNATAFGASCIQYVPKTDAGPGEDIFDKLFNQHPPESENCLFVNAFAPASPGPRDGRPVVVFIPGGGWTMGDGRLDMAGFAGYEDIVAVTFNYRTNIFGFPNAPGMPLGERNLGLHDQRRALAWVQANARAFGGDPRKVTIWGESAGAMSVDIHMHALAAAPPFRAAIMSSGEYSFGMFAMASRPDDTGRSWDNVVEEVGCGNNSSHNSSSNSSSSSDHDSNSHSKDTLKCMSRVPADRLLAGLHKAGASYNPIADNATVPAGRAAAWRQGKTARVPVLATTMAEEARALLNRNITMARFLEAYFPPALVPKALQDAILAHYRSKQRRPAPETDFDVAAAISTDFHWQCPQRLLGSASASAPRALRQPVWRGYFNASIADTLLLPDEFRWLGKFHGTDVLLAFMAPSYDELNAVLPAPLPPQLYAFANYYRAMVGAFVRNPAAGPGWPAVTAATEKGHYASFDVASLGDVGDVRTGGATPVNATALDESCALYEDVYPLLEQVMG